jgi:hypothetical protein
VLLDDEWHAVHKLMTSSVRDILQTFGMADHSPPLTVLYKFMADTIGLAEGRMRALQIACGIALVPVCGVARVARHRRRPGRRALRLPRVGRRPSS